MVYYLTYLSSSKGLFSEAELANILSVSRKNNEGLEITGILLYNDGNILQVLEGDEERVKSLYKKIEQDDRHTGIITMAEGFSAERTFPDWSMGFRMVSKTEWSELTGFVKLDAQSVLSKIKASDNETGLIVDSYIQQIR